MTELKDQDKNSREYLTRLRELLTTRFDEGELRTLCFDLGADYDSLPGEGKSNKARELVARIERYKRLTELVDAGKKLRPDIPWPLSDADSYDDLKARTERDTRKPSPVESIQHTTTEKRSPFFSWPRSDVNEFLERSALDLTAIDSAVLTFMCPSFRNIDWGWNEDEVDFIRADDLVDEELPGELREFGRRFIAENPKRLNSMKYCVVKWSLDLPAGFRLVIRVRPITYLRAYPVAKELAEFIGTPRNRALRNRFFSKLTDYSRPFRPNMLIAHILVVTGDDKVLLLRRKPNLDYFPGHWSASFEEHYNAPWSGYLHREEVHPESFDADNTVFDGIKRGLNEEMRLSEKEITDTTIRVIGIGFEYDNFLTNVYAIAELPSQLTYEKMHHRLSASVEHDRIASCPFDLHFLLPSLTRGTTPNNLHSSIAISEQQWKWHPTARMRIFLALCRRFGKANVYATINGNS